MRINLKIEPSNRTNHFMNRTKQKFGLVLATICLTSGLAVPTFCGTQNAANQIATQAATNSGWTFTGSLNRNHYFHTATLLSNGKVLVAGGAADGYNAASSSAELYDPFTGTWSYTGSLNTARVYHTATLLQNGQVLVAGGAIDVFGNFHINSTELYDQVTGQWLQTGSFNTIRALQSATLLPNGKVLALGASHEKSPIVYSAELYDPSTGTWSITSAPSAGGSAVLLTNGKVLAVSRNSAELYDPDAERWSSAGTLNRLRFTLTVTLLRNGKVLVTGSSGYESPYLAAEVFDPATGIWSITGSPNTARSDAFYTSTLLADGHVLLTGEYASFSLVSGEELYDPDSETWSLTGRLIAARDSHTATVLQNGEVLIAGGIDGFYDDLPGFLVSAEIGHDLATIPIAIPRIVSASVEGKRLFVVGENFDPGAVILRNGMDQITKNDPQNRQTALTGKRAGKKLKPGDSLRVRNPNGTASEEFTFTGS